MKKPFNLKSFVINTLRRASYRHPGRTQALTKARVSRGLYECKMCGPGKTYSRHDISADHILAVVDPEKGFTTWDEYIFRLYCDESGYQILCTYHHDLKSQGENQIRKRTRQERNADRRKVRAKTKARNPATNKHTGSSLDEFLKECGISLEDPKPTKKQKRY